MLSNNVSVPPLIPADAVDINGIVMFDLKSSTYINDVSCWKIPVDTYSLVNVSLNGPVGNFKTILLTGQTNPIENGLYEIRNASWARSPDLPSGTDSVGCMVLCKTQYTAYFECTSGGIVGVDPLIFAKCMVANVPVGAQGAIQLKDSNFDSFYASPYFTFDPNTKTLKIGGPQIVENLLFDTIITNNTIYDIVGQSSTLTIKTTNYQAGNGNITFNSVSQITIETGDVLSITGRVINFSSIGAFLCDNFSGPISITNNLVVVSKINSPIQFKNGGMSMTKQVLNVVFPNGLIFSAPQALINITSVNIPADSSVIIYTTNNYALGARNTFASVRSWNGSGSPKVIWDDGHIIIFNLDPINAMVGDLSVSFITF